jgi:hypothetical protein
LKNPNGLRDGQGSDYNELEGFVISVFRNFFLDLSVDQIENLSTNFAKKFINEKIEENTPA